MRVQLGLQDNDHPLCVEAGFNDVSVFYRDDKVACIPVPEIYASYNKIGPAYATKDELVETLKKLIEEDKNES